MYFIVFECYIFLYLSFVFKDGQFPNDVMKMKDLRWLRLNRTKLDTLPYELGNLKKIVSALQNSKLKS